MILARIHDPEDFGQRDLECDARRTGPALHLRERRDPLALAEDAFDRDGEIRPELEHLLVQRNHLASTPTPGAPP